jgi:hypothetical protein
MPADHTISAALTQKANKQISHPVHIFKIAERSKCCKKRGREYPPDKFAVLLFLLVESDLDHDDLNYLGKYGIAGGHKIKRDDSTDMSAYP